MVDMIGAAVHLQTGIGIGVKGNGVFRPGQIQICGSGTGTNKAYPAFADGKHDRFVSDHDKSHWSAWKCNAGWMIWAICVIADVFDKPYFTIS